MATVEEFPRTPITIESTNSIKSKGKKNDPKDPERFKGNGVVFRAKFIGEVTVPEPRGDKMCQEQLVKLKATVKGSKIHKKKIYVHVSLEGLNIVDQLSGTTTFHHPVHHISFISRDVTDSRAFGYIYGGGEGDHKFYAIKTDRAAENLVLTLRDLFQVVFELKKEAIETAKKNQESGVNGQPESIYQIPKNGAPVQPVVNQEGIYSVPGSNAPVLKTGGQEVSNLLDLANELETIQQGIDTMESWFTQGSATPAADPWGSSTTQTQPQVGTPVGSPVGSPTSPPAPVQASNSLAELESDLFSAVSGTQITTSSSGLQNVFQSSNSSVLQNSQPAFQIGQNQGTFPGQQQGTFPGHQQGAFHANQQMPFGVQQQTGMQQAAIQGQMSMKLPAQQGTAFTMLPGQPETTFPGQQSTMLPGQQTSMSLGQQPTMLPGQQSTMLQGQQSAPFSMQQTISSPSQQSTMITGQHSTMLLGQQSTMLPGQQSTILPGQQSTILPGQQSTILPGQQATILPGQQATILPGQQSTAFSMQQSTISPGQQSTMLPGHQSAMLPGQQSPMSLGQQSVAFTMQQPVVSPLLFTPPTQSHANLLPVTQDPFANDPFGGLSTHNTINSPRPVGTLAFNGTNASNIAQPAQQPVNMFSVTSPTMQSAPNITGGNPFGVQTNPSLFGESSMISSTADEQTLQPMIHASQQPSSPPVLFGDLCDLGTKNTAKRTPKDMFAIQAPPKKSLNDLLSKPDVPPRMADVVIKQMQASDVDSDSSLEPNAARRAHDVATPTMEPSSLPEAVHDISKNIHPAQNHPPSMLDSTTSSTSMNNENSLLDRTYNSEMDNPFDIPLRKDSTKTDKCTEHESSDNPFATDFSAYSQNDNKSEQLSAPWDKNDGTIGAGPVVADPFSTFPSHLTKSVSNNSSVEPNLTPSINNHLSTDDFDLPSPQGPPPPLPNKLSDSAVPVPPPRPSSVSGSTPPSIPPRAATVDNFVFLPKPPAPKPRRNVPSTTSSIISGKGAINGSDPFADFDQRLAGASYSVVVKEGDAFGKIEATENPFGSLSPAFK